MTRLILGVLCALVLSACQVPGLQALGQTNLQPTALARQDFSCVVGDRIPENVPGMMRISMFAVWQGLSVHPYIAGGKIVGDYALNLLKAAQRGEVNHWDGNSDVQILIHYPNDAAMPHSVPYLGGLNICRGMKPVVPVRKGIYSVQIPIDGGLGMGYAAIILPRNAFITPNMRAWVCIKPRMHTAYLPTLASGPYKGLSDVVCGLPGSVAGTTLLAQKAREGALGEVFPLIVEREKP